MLPPEEMWCSPRQSTGSYRVRLRSGGVVLPAEPSTTLHRLVSGPLTFACSDRHLDEIQVIWWGVGAVRKVNTSRGFDLLLHLNTEYSLSAIWGILGGFSNTVVSYFLQLSTFFTYF